MSKDLNETINLLNEVMYSPNFSQDEFEKAKAKIRAYFESIEKDGSNNMLVELYPGYFRSPKEILNGLDKMTLNDVIKHHSDMINKSSSNYVVTAPFNKNTNMKQNVVNLLLSDPDVYIDFMPKLSNVYKPIDKSTEIVYKMEINQTKMYKTYY